MTKMHTPQDVHFRYYSRSRDRREVGEQYGILFECEIHTVRLLSFNFVRQRKRLQLALATSLL
jgi:hypothetical protein